LENIQDGPVIGLIEKHVAVPTRSQRPRFSLAVINYAGDNKIGFVEGRAIGMDQGITEFAALMNRTWCFRCGMAWMPPGNENSLNRRFKLSTSWPMAG
jgi:hypothetical protein